jgi:hypothetical protein
VFVQPVLQCESNNYYIFWGCDCSHRYPACNVRHITQSICGLSSSTTFSHIISQMARFKQTNKQKNKMYVLIFSTKFVWNISCSKKNRVRYDQKLYIGLHVKYTLFLSDFNETWIFLTDFRKILQYKISRNLSSGSQVIPYGWTAGQTNSHNEANSHFSQFCKFA